MKEGHNISVTSAKLLYFRLPDYTDAGVSENFEFDIKPFEIEADTESKKLVFHAFINITALKNESEAAHEQMLETEAEVIFSYSDEDKPDDEIQKSLSAIAYSTIRGLISGLTRGTAFHKAYLPMQEVSTTSATETEMPEPLEEHEIETPNPPM